MKNTKVNLEFHRDLFNTTAFYITDYIRRMVSTGKFKFKCVL